MAPSRQSFEVIGRVKFASTCAGCGRAVPLVGARYCEECFLGADRAASSRAAPPSRTFAVVARVVVVADEIADPRAEVEARGRAVAAGHVKNVAHLAGSGLAGARGCRCCGGVAAAHEGGLM